MNFIDRVLLNVAPGVAARRFGAQLQAKMVADQVRKYDGASGGRRTAGWRGLATSANAETERAAGKLRVNAREAERNNPWARKAIEVVVANVVGTGIVAQARHPNRRRVAAAQDLWKQWADTTACDFEGRNDLYGLQALALAAVVRDGEAIVRFRRVTDGPVPLKIQILETDFLDVLKTQADNGNRVVQGVELDAEGREVAVWLLRAHPGDSSMIAGTSVRVPAGEYVRVYRQDRPGQLRGVSWLAPVLLSLYDLDEYEDAQLVRQKIAACFAVFVRDAVSDVSPVARQATELPERVEPGIIETLPAGKDVTFASPPSADGYGDYLRSVLHRIAAGVGVTYEALTGDLSQTNYSSGRMGWLEFGRNIDGWRWRLLIPQMLTPVWRAFTEAAVLRGVSIGDVGADWTPPRRELVSPKDDVPAIIREIRGGLTSWSEAVRERGYDPDALASEIAADRARFEQMGIVVDSDPVVTTQVGQIQKSTGTGLSGSGGSNVVG